MIRVAVMGLGRMGAAYDIMPHSGVPRSHVGAIAAAEAFVPVALADPDPAARQAVAARWPAFAQLVSERLPEAVEADVVVLATPTASRLEDVKRAVAVRPRLLIVEKPLASSLGEARAIMRLLADANIAGRVNFHRRFDPRFVAGKQSMPGRPRHVIGRYGKGLYNYGSHMVDLLLDWLGPVSLVQALGPVPDGSDPNISFRCEFQQGGYATVIGLDGLNYDQFDLELLFDRERWEIGGGGIVWRRQAAVADLYHPGYCHLAEPEIIGAAGPVEGLVQLYDAVRAHFVRHVPMPGCDAGAALSGIEILDAVQRSAATGCSVTFQGEG